MRRQLIPLPLIGMDSGGDPKLQRGGPLILENAILETRETVTKRLGTTAISTAAAGKGLASFKDNPVALGGDDAQVYDGTNPTGGGWDRLPGGIQSSAELLATKILRKGLISPSYKLVSVSAKQSGDILAVAWTEENLAGSLWRTQCATYSVRTEALIQLADISSGWAIYNYHARIAKLSTGDLILLAKQNGDEIKAHGISAAGAIDTSTPQTIYSLTEEAEAFDICCPPGSGALFVALIKNTTHERVLRCCYGWSGSAFSSINSDTSSETSVTHVAVFSYDTDEAICCWLVGTTLYAEGFNKSGTTVATKGSETGLTSNPARLTGATLSAGSSWYTFVDDHTAAPATVEQTAWSESGGAAVSGTLYTHKEVLLASQAFGDGSDVWCCLAVDPRTNDVTDADDQLGLEARKIQLFNMEPTGIVSAARFLEGYAADPSALANRLPEIEDLGSNVWQVPFLTIRDLDGDADAADMITIDRSPQRTIAHEIGGTLLIPGALPMQVVSGELLEAGFAHPPAVKVTQGGTGGNTLDNGASYGVVAVAERVDRDGVVHQSAPSPVVTFTNDSAKNAPVFYATIPWNQRHFSRVVIGGGYYEAVGIRIAFYRTLGNGSTFYRLVESRKLTNETFYTTDTNVSDANLLSEGALYTTSPGAVQNDPALAHEIACVWDRRYCYVPSESPQEVRYSKTAVRGEGIRHAHAFTVPMRVGDITALAAANDRLIVWTEREIWALVSRGEGVLDDSHDFDDPVLINPGVGCSDHGTVVATSQGWMFWSSARRRLCLLTRDLQVVPIEECAYWTDTYDVICAAYDPKREIALFGTDGGPTLVYYLAHNAWVIWTEALTDVVAMTIARDGTLYYRRGSSSSTWNTVRVETAGLYDDGAGFTGPNLAVDLGWLSFAGIQGFANHSRIVAAGQAKAAHNLKCKQAFDGVPQWDSTVEQDYDTSSGIATYWDLSKHWTMDLGGSPEGKAYAVEFVAGRYRTKQGWRFRLSDEGSSDGENLSISFVGVVVGIDDRLAQGVPLDADRQGS